MGVIGLKCALACLAGLLAVWLPGCRPLVELPARKYRWAFWTLAATARAPLFVLLYLVLGIEVPSDVSGYYVPEATKALAGQLVYRDFQSSYGPGFPYLVGFALWLFGSAKALVAVAIAFELGALAVWGRVARRLGWDELAVRRGELLYLASAVPLLTIALAGQNQSWLALSVGLSLLWSLRGRPTLAALAALWGALFVKALAVPFWLPALALAQRSGKRASVHFCIWLGGGLALALGLLLFFGADPTLPLRLEVGRTSPGNLPFLVSTLLARAGLTLPSWLAWLGFVAVAAWLLRRMGTQESDGPRRIWQQTAALWLAFLLFAPKAFPGYFVLAALPIAVSAARTHRARVVYAVWQAVLAVLPSIWFRLLPAAGGPASSAGLAWLVLLHAAVLVPGVWLLRDVVSVSVDTQSS